MPEKHNFKRDRYSKARGGSSKFINIHCVPCGTRVLLYQKDGPGNLLRLYLDRIFEPANLAELQAMTNVRSVPNLYCPQCNALIATPMVYDPESRLALRLVPGAFSKHKSDGTITPPSTS